MCINPSPSSLPPTPQHQQHLHLQQHHQAPVPEEESTTRISSCELVGDVPISPDSHQGTHYHELRMLSDTTPTSVITTTTTAITTVAPQVLPPKTPLRRGVPIGSTWKRIEPAPVGTQHPQLRKHPITPSTTTVSRTISTTINTTTTTSADSSVKSYKHLLASPRISKVNVTYATTTITSSTTSTTITTTGTPNTGGEVSIASSRETSDKKNKKKATKLPLSKVNLRKSRQNENKLNVSESLGVTLNGILQHRDYSLSVSLWTPHRYPLMLACMFTTHLLVT